MPRAKMLPTPASSTEIKGQDHSSKLSSLQLTFELPPSAINSGEAPKPSRSNSKMSPVSPTSKLPYLQPSETVKARRRSSTAQQQQQQQQQQKETFALPPPPTKSRKIIQMKPRPQAEAAAAAAATVAPPAKGSVNTGGHAKNAGTAMTGSKSTGTAKKQPSATSAAGRKIARKTAHSLIERRRRSKMNEEFAVLKGLIPACTGEMHKLAILQASIEYVRYLEDCIAKLKAQHDGGGGGGGGGSGPDPTTPSEFRPGHHRDSCDDDEDDNDDNDEEREWATATNAAAAAAAAGAMAMQEDVEMTDSEATPSPPTFTTAPPSTSTTSTPSSCVSPALLAQDARSSRHRSLSSHAPLPSDYQPYAPRTSASTTTTTTGGPSPTHSSSGGGGGGGGCYGYTSSALASPALRPQLEIDHEVSAALLMLGGGGGGVGGGGAPANLHQHHQLQHQHANAGSSSSSIGAGGVGSARGMSVQDLLSS